MAYPLDPDDPTADLATTCVYYSTRIANRALSRIGVGKLLVSLKDDKSQEAVMAREAFTPAVNRVLGDFPWAFATRYAKLALALDPATGVAYAVPANGDWLYAYRVPDDMLYARRVVPQLGTATVALPAMSYPYPSPIPASGRAYDPNPIPWRLGSDADGPLLFANAEATDAAPLELEYTYRPDCPARMGPPAFRSALAWIIAAELAPTLSRNGLTQQQCLALYDLDLRAAGAHDANEQQPEPDGDAAWISGR